MEVSTGSIDPKPAAPLWVTSITSFPAAVHPFEMSIEKVTLSVVGPTSVHPEGDLTATIPVRFTISEPNIDAMYDHCDHESESAVIPEARQRDCELYGQPKRNSGIRKRPEQSFSDADIGQYLPDIVIEQRSRQLHARIQHALRFTKRKCQRD